MPHLSIHDRFATCMYSGSSPKCLEVYELRGTFTKVPKKFLEFSGKVSEFLGNFSEFPGKFA